MTLCDETYLFEVLLKMTQLQALLQFQLVFGPELLESILCLIQLSQEPKIKVLYKTRSLKVNMQHTMCNNPSPLHRGLIFQLIWAQLVLLCPAGLFFNAA